MPVVPEVKRRSGFDPHQPRDRKGRWVETGAEVRNSITHLGGTVTRIIRGDAFHENRYEVRTSDGQTQTWETSAVDVVRNPDGSAPSEHAPGTHPEAPATHPGAPAAHSAAAGAIGEVYAGQAPDKPQAGHSPVDHAVDAVYGQPHPDRPARVADAVGNVYAAQAPDKPQAGRTPVSHAVDATHGTPAAPAARPDLGGAIDAVYGAPAAPSAPGVRNLPGRNYVAKPPRGVDPQRFEEVQAPQRAQLGLDNRWIVGGDGRGYTPVMALKPGDVVSTHTDGTEVHIPKVPSGTTLARYARTPRTVDWVEQGGMGYYTVHFTDGTSSTPASARARAFASLPRERGDANVPDGGTPDRPPAPVKRFATVEDAQAHARTLGNDFIADMAPSDLALSDGGGLLVFKYGRGDWQANATGPMQSLGGLSSFTTKKDALAFANRIERENPNVHFSGDDLKDQIRAGQGIKLTDLLRTRVDFDRQRGATDARSQQWAEQLRQSEERTAQMDARNARVGEQGYTEQRAARDLRPGDEIAYDYLTPVRGRGFRTADGQEVSNEVVTVRGVVTGPGVEVQRGKNDYGDGNSGIRYPLADMTFETRDGRTGSVTATHTPTISTTNVDVRPVSQRAVADMTDDELTAEYDRLDPTVPGNASLQGNPHADDIRARLDALAGERQRRDTERANIERQIRDENAREADARYDAAEQYTEGDLVRYTVPGTIRTEVGTVERIDRTGPGTSTSDAPGSNQTLNIPADAQHDAYLAIRSRRDGTLEEHVDPREVTPAGEDANRPAPQVPDGPLAEPVRTALAALNGTNGVSDYDLEDHARQLGTVASGNADREYAHSLVDDVRNGLINTTDGGDRQAASNALDALDTAIDTHEDALNPPLPAGQFPMPTVDQLDRAIGDLDAADVPDMTTPEIMGHIATLDPLVNGWIQGRGDRSNPFFAQSVEVLDALEAERDTRDDVPVDPGGTGSLFGEDATPDVPAGESVRAGDLAVGDSITYTTADNIVVSGEIEGLHTAGPNIVATLRMPDDRRETRAFRRDAEVNRTAAAAPPVTEDVAARDLRMGQRFMLQDASGAYHPATVLHVSRESGGSALVVDVSRDDGTHETTYVDPGEVLPRITDRTREPDLPPMPDPAPEDGTKFASGLQPGDRIASYGDNITVVRARVAADGLVHARVRLANGAEDDVTYTPDATVTLADPPSTVDITPHTAGTATTRPTLYTYQRNGIVALNLDAADSAQPPLVQQAAARVRNRQALSEEQSAALADALRAQATAPGVRAPRQRTLQRQAAALDAAAAAAGGRVPPVTPNRDTVEKTRPANLVAGDWVALRGQGAAGGVDVVQVLDSRAMMGGRLHELTVRDADGNQSRRLVAGNADTYLLPDLPRDLPAPPESDTPRAEHISVDRLEAGDTIRFAHTDPSTYATTVREARVTMVATMGGQGSRVVGIHVDVDGTDYMIRQRTNAPDSSNVIVRTARGPASQEQPYDSLLPAERPEVLRSVGDVAVGDRVSVPAVMGVDHVGVVHAIEKVSTDDGTPGIRIQLRQDNGDVNTVVIFNDDPAKVTRLAKGDEGAAQRIQQMYAERERQLLANAARTKIEGFRSQILTYEVRPNPYGTPEDAAAGVERGRDDPGAHPSRNIRTTAKKIAEYLAPDGADEGQRALIADRVEPILRQVREEYLTNLAESLRQVPADQTGINNSGWVQRVIDQHRQSPSTRDFGRISRTLADAAASLQGGGDSQQGATPDFTLPEGADLATRMRAYREAIGGNGQGFGKTRVTRTVFKAPTLDDLEAGRVPETEAATTFVSDRAADGGPGEVAMRHHDVLLAAGRDLDAEVQRRIVARDSSLGADPEATLADLKAQVKEASEANGAAWNAYFNVPRDDLDARAQAREAMDSAAARSKEVNDRYQKMNMRLSRLRREVAMEIIAEHRQVGGVELGWVNNKGELLTNRSKLVKAMRSAEAVYPTEWLQAFKDRTRGKFLLKSSKRGHFVEGREITLSDKAIKYEGGGPQDDVAVHELGHGMEWVVPGLAQAEEAFLWARTSDGPVGSRTRQKQSAIYKGSKEYGFKDDFPEHYTGKTYSDGGKYFEVFTTSVESVFAGSPYADEGMRAFTLGSMILL